MIHFKFSDADTRYLFLKGDTNQDIIRIEEFKSYCNMVDPVCYLPSWGHRPKITQDFVFEYIQNSGDKLWYCSIGLWQDAYKFFKSKNYEFDGLLENSNLFKIKPKHTFEEFKSIVDSWGLAFNPRPYQYEAAYKILQWRKSLSEMATRAGKTLIAYMIFRYALEYMGVKRILMIVPSISLVRQGYDDFSSYAEFFHTECIWGGGKLVESANLTIGTFQSLIGFLDRQSKKYNPSFFDKYDCVCVDETHRASAKQIRTIISQPFMKNVKLAFGVTGTLPEEHSIEHFCITSILGAKIQTITPKELMDAGYIAGVDITQVHLNYKDISYQQDIFIKCAEYAMSEFVYEPNPKNPKKKNKIKIDNPEHQLMYKKELPFAIEQMRNAIEMNSSSEEEFKTNYIKSLKQVIKDSMGSNMLAIERMMAHFMDYRIEYLCNNILPNCPNNTLILAHHTEYIKYFTKIIEERFSYRHIAVITGSVNDKKREEIKQLLRDNNDCILIASYGTMSTGITLANLCYGVLFESFKSNIVNMQSIGRGLGLSDMKEEYKLYDIIDCFDSKKISNKIALQGIAKTKIYKNNQYKYNIVNINA